MGYLFSHFWIFIALAFVLGAFVGWSTCGRDSIEHRSNWLSWALALSVVGLFLAVFRVIPGFCGLALEVGLLLFGAYIVGCAVGCAFGDKGGHDGQGHDGQAGGHGGPLSSDAHILHEGAQEHGDAHAGDVHSHGGVLHVASTSNGLTHTSSSPVSAPSSVVGLATPASPTVDISAEAANGAALSDLGGAAKSIARTASHGGVLLSPVVGDNGEEKSGGEEARLAAAAEKVRERLAALAAAEAESARAAAMAADAENARKMAAAKEAEQARLAAAEEKERERLAALAAAEAESARASAMAADAENARKMVAAKDVEQTPSVVRDFEKSMIIGASFLPADSDPNAPADNLKWIKGVGPKNEAALNGLGVRRFAQIASWTRGNALWVGERLSFPGRIEREQWIVQARVC